MPRNPCYARIPASEARTFAPRCGVKVTAFFRLSEKSKDFSDSRKQEAPVHHRGLLLVCVVKEREKWEISISSGYGLIITGK